MSGAPLTREPQPGTNYGTDIGISTATPGVTNTIYRAQFKELCWTKGVAPRQYFHVNENSYEFNYPILTLCGVYPILACFEPDSCPLLCDGKDFIGKAYYDRGVFDTQNFWWNIGFYNGTPSLHANEIKFVCCCTDCPVIYNEFAACYFASICGDRVRVVQFETCCWGLGKNRATCWTNYFGLCGPKDGEPLQLSPFACCLLEGSGEALVQSVDQARGQWKTRTGKL